MGFWERFFFAGMKVEFLFRCELMTRGSLVSTRLPHLEESEGERETLTLGY